MRSPAQQKQYEKVRLEIAKYIATIRSTPVLYCNEAADHILSLEGLGIIDTDQTFPKYGLSRNSSALNESANNGYETACIRVRTQGFKRLIPKDH